MIVALVILLVGVGTIAFHFWSPWWLTPVASNWGSIDTTIIITFWVCGVVFAGVILFMAYCLYKFRHRPGHKAEYEPENKKLEVWLTSVTAIGVAIMLAPGLIVWNDFVNIPDDAAEFEVVGRQWDWIYRFPGADGELGKTDFRKINFDNPFGIDEADPKGLDDILVEDFEVHLPLGKSVKVLNRSIDVLHDFYVPEIRAKMDMVPGTVTLFWFTPTRTGTFDILCAELCGSGHYAMRGALVIDEIADFEAWLAEQSTYAELKAEASLQRGVVVSQLNEDVSSGTVQ
jgi:cytochrome c oxidase subunit 2